MARIKKVKSIKDTRRLVRGDFVDVTFAVEFDGGKKAELVNRGVFYKVAGDKLSVVTPVIGNVHPPIGISEYSWSSGERAFRSITGTDKPYFPFKEGSRTFRHYEGLLKQLGDAE